MLQLRNIRKSYHAKEVLHFPLLEIENGIYWVKGTNGSGKTTFLKMIAGLLPFEGDILFNDISLKVKPVLYRRNIGWAEAEPKYPSFLTGTELIRFYSRIKKSSDDEARQLAGFLGIGDYVDTPVGTYSEGMTKKLSLTLGFLGNPSLIILDEPLITLDADASGRVSELIMQRAQEKGTTVLMSSHQKPDQNLVNKMKGLVVNNREITAE